MNKKIFLAAAVLALALMSLGFVFQSRPAQWEYNETCKWNEVAKLGNDGWEMFAVTQDGAVGCYYFKRAK